MVSLVNVCLDCRWHGNYRCHDNYRWQRLQLPWQRQMTWRHWLTTVPMIRVPLRVIMNIDYVCPTALSAIFQLYLCGHVYCWRKLEFSVKSTICIWFVTRTRGTSCLTTQKLDLYCYTSGSLAFNLFLLFFFNSRQFCCKNMNYNNLSETYVCIHIKIMNYRGKLKTLITEKR